MFRISTLLFVLFMSLPVTAEEAIVARVNGASITAKELDAAVDRLIPRATFHGTITEERRSEFRDQALQELITTELQYQDALLQGLKPDKKLVKEQLEEIRSRFKSKKEYKSALEQAKMTEDQLQQQIEKRILVQAVFNKTVTEPAGVSDAELRDYYEKNTKKFKQPESMRLRIISAGSEAKAGSALARLKAGEDFGSVAATTSEDNYRIKGGDIGYVHRGTIIPELENVALQMKQGQVRGPIKAEGEWFIIKLEDRKAERQFSFEESREKLKKELEKKRAGELLEKWNAGLRAKAKIEIPNAAQSNAN